MNYRQIEHIVSPERLGRYLHSCNGDKRKAVELYRLNMQLSYNLFAVICYFEVALRNGINDVLKLRMGEDWLRDAVIRRPCAFGGNQLEKTRRKIRRAYYKQVEKGNYTHTRLLSSMDFGTWRYMYSAPQFIATGRCLMAVFPNRPIPPIGISYNQKYLFRRLEEVNKVRNRIAHHEPICFVSGTNTHSTQYVRQNYQLLLELITWMGIDASNLLRNSEKVLTICDKIDNL